MNENQINLQNNGTKQKKSKKGYIIIPILVILLALSTLFIIKNLNKEKEIDSEITSEIKKSAYRINSNSLEKFDLYFLQLENGKQNKIYSPLSIKYALEMLEEGTTGESKAQISNIIGSYKANKYVNSKNMAFENAIFINEFYKDSIKNEYASNLKNKYNAAVITTPFDSPNEVNSWISNNTLGLINNLYNDISQNNFLLLNALAIDMEWEENFIPQTGEVEFAIYKHENFYWSGGDELIPKNFKDMDEEVSTMEIIASFNNYDIVKELGKENIRKKVKEEYLKYLEDGGYIELYEYEIYLGEKINGLSEEEIKEKYLDEYIEKFLDKYIEDIDSNYKRVDKITDFSLYVDDDVKVFAKDLKKYNGSQLQYVAIMPTNEDLDNYISKVKVETINKYIENLKKLKAGNFKEGVVTKISGFIPKFKFEYQLDLMNDLKKLGITNVFEEGKANLENISSDKSLYINGATHKANIEFTQDGIKAAAVTEFGAGGAGAPFDYLFDVPVEEIDLTFDKPYMFIIRDLNSGEVWFTGTVYNPLLYSLDTTNPIPGASR